MRIGCVDFVSNTFFPATAAEELGCFAAEGVEAHVELLRTLVAFPALRDGEVEFLAAPAHSVLRAFPDWKGAKLVVALAQGTPWLVVLRSDVPGERGDVTALKGLRIAAAQGPNLVFRQFLIELGLEPDRDVQIISLPGGEDADVNFGVLAARALEDGLIDGFFANAMGAEVSIRRRIGKNPHRPTARRQSLRRRKPLYLRSPHHHGRRDRAPQDRSRLRGPRHREGATGSSCRPGARNRGRQTPVSARRCRTDRVSRDARPAVLRSEDHGRVRCRGQPVCAVA